MDVQIVDLLVRYLRSRPEHLVLYELQREAFVQAYSVLETYLQGKSRKNGLYFAKHIDYFSTQYSVRVSETFCGHLQSCFNRDAPIKTGMQHAAHLTSTRKGVFDFERTHGERIETFHSIVCRVTRILNSSQ